MLLEHTVPHRAPIHSGLHLQNLQSALGRACLCTAYLNHYFETNRFRILRCNSLIDSPACRPPTWRWPTMLSLFILCESIRKQEFAFWIIMILNQRSVQQAFL